MKQLPSGQKPAEHIVLPRRSNLLLSSLDPDGLRRVKSSLRPVSFDFGHVLNEPGAPITAAFFPASGLFSTTVTMDDGGTVETGGTGYEGIVGIPLFYGRSTGVSLVTCEIPGAGHLMPVDVFRSELDQRGPFHDAVARFALAISVQAMQLAACNRLHNVDERLARWILMAHDRAGTARFPLTQQFLAFMLGVHRPSVTPVAGALQQAGVIEYRRGIVTVRDRERLEECACECYRHIREVFGDLRPQHDTGSPEE